VQLAKEFLPNQVTTTLWSYAKMARNPGERVLAALEKHLEEESVKGFIAQDVSNTLWAFATMGRDPGEGILAALGKRLEVVITDFIEQHVANTLWAYATIGKNPGERVMQILDRRWEETLPTIYAQGLSNTLWAAATMGRMPCPRVYALIEQRMVELAGDGSEQDVSNAMWSFATLCALTRTPTSAGKTPREEVVRALEARMPQVVGHFHNQATSNVLWSYAKLARRPDKQVLALLVAKMEEEGGAAQFSEQHVSNVLWAFASLGLIPEEHLLQQLLLRLEALVSVSTPQAVANVLWAFAAMGTSPGDRLLTKLETQALIHLRESTFKPRHLSQLHQYMLSGRVDSIFGCVEAGKERESFRQLWGAAAEAAQRQFIEGSDPAAPSKRQVQVSHIVRDKMGMHVQDEYLCPRSGYSIDMLVSEPPNQAEGKGRAWALEYDGGTHFLQPCGSPTGRTLLKRRHLRLLGYALVR
jgi:hypothetical protein